MSSRRHKTNVLTSKLETEIDLLQRHVDILKLIAQNEPIGIIRLAELLKCPQHKVRYSLRILEQENLIEPSAGGAVTTKKAVEFNIDLQTILENMSINIKRIQDSLG